MLYIILIHYEYKYVMIIFRFLFFFFKKNMVQLLPTINLPTSHEFLTVLRAEHNGCFQTYKFTPYFYTHELHNFMSAITPSLLKVMQQLYTTPCKVQLSIKFCFTKDELDDTGHVTKLTSTVITKEHQACIFNDDEACDYINLAMDHFNEFIN